MKKLLAFSGSNSSTSINNKLVSYVVSEIKECQTTILDLKDYPMSIYSEDEENKGFPEMVLTLKAKIKESDALIISVNEHNGSFSAFFKNVIDWLSRADRNFLEEKKILLLSTSPGKRGGLTALEYAKSIFPRFGGEIVESFSFPSFYENFDKEMAKITNETLLLGLRQVISTFTHQIQ